MLWYTVCLITVGAVAENTNPYFITCNPNQIDITQDKFIHELFDMAEYLGEIENILARGQERVRGKLDELGEKLSKVQYSEINIDIIRCFENATNETEENLREFYHLIKARSVVLVEYVQNALNSIRDCSNLVTTCEVIELCCDEVVENFDVKGLITSVQQLDELGDRFLEPILYKLDEDIDSVEKTTSFCVLELENAKYEEEKRLINKKHRTPHKIRD